MNYQLLTERRSIWRWKWTILLGASTLLFLAALDASVFVHAVAEFTRDLALLVNFLGFTVALIVLDPLGHPDQPNEIGMMALVFLIGGGPWLIITTSLGYLIDARRIAGRCESRRLVPRPVLPRSCAEGCDE